MAAFDKPGWCNLYISTGYGISKRFLNDFPDESADLVFSSHFIEHIHPKQVQVLLRNIRRILKQDGIVRISGPDMNIFTDMVLRGQEAFMSFVDTFYERSAMGCDYIQWYLYMGGNPDEFGVPNDHPPTRHCWSVTANTLVYYLVAAGFSPASIKKSSFRESEVPELRDPAFDNRPEISFFVEAKK